MPRHSAALLPLFVSGQSWRQVGDHRWARESRGYHLRVNQCRYCRAYWYGIGAAEPWGPFPSLEAACEAAMEAARARPAL